MLGGLLFSVPRVLRLAALLVLGVLMAMIVTTYAVRGVAGGQTMAPLTGASVEANIPPEYEAIMRQVAAGPANSCGVDWQSLGAISRWETRHGESFGADAQLDAEGNFRGGEIRNQDGAYQSWGIYQMQTYNWPVYGADGNGDGAVDRASLADGTATTISLLCALGWAQSPAQAFAQYNGGPDERAPTAAECADVAQPDDDPRNDPRAPQRYSCLVQTERARLGAASIAPPTRGVGGSWLGETAAFWTGVADRVGGAAGPADEATMASGAAGAVRFAAGFFAWLDSGSTAAVQGVLPDVDPQVEIKTDGDRLRAAVPKAVRWSPCDASYAHPAPPPDAQLTPEELSRIFTEINEVFGGDKAAGQHRSTDPSERFLAGRDPCSTHLVGLGIDTNGPHMASIARWAAPLVGTSPEHPFVMVEYWNRYHYGHHCHLSANPNYRYDTVAHLLPKGALP
jgi:hypothetical protein